MVSRALPDIRLTKSFTPTELWGDGKESNAVPAQYIPIYIPEGYKPHIEGDGGNNVGGDDLGQFVGGLICRRRELVQ